MGATSLFSQPYLSALNDSTSQWNIVIDGYCDATCTSEFTHESDTIINGNNYSVLKAGANQFIFVREDTTLGKMWYYENQYFQTEYLIMDLSLGLGDTFNIYTDTNPSPYIVDSVFTFNSRKHVRLSAVLSICSPELKIEFIEGVGTNAGLAYQGKGNYTPDMLVCYKEDTTVIFQNVMFPNTCFICFVGLEEHKFDFEVIPNPVEEEIKINFIHEEFAKIEITDIRGRLIYSYHGLLKEHSISGSHLEQGQYILKVATEDGKFNSKKFIKR